MITTTEFENVYWAHYISLEREFSETLRYVTLSSDNYETYSEAYLKLILQIGSEIDIILKDYCHFRDDSFSAQTINGYRLWIINNEPTFSSQSIILTQNAEHISPWISWCNQNPQNPDWWVAYNKIKHNRTDFVAISGEHKKAYKYATQKNVLFLLAALYEIEIYYYYYLSDFHGKSLRTPLPGSRLFRLTGSFWENVTFYGDTALMIEDGCLRMYTSTLHY